VAGAGRYAALLAGGALTQVAAGAHLAWGMVLGSGVDLGGDVGERWLQNVSAAMVAVGVIVAGRLLDRGRSLLAACGGIVALIAGVGAGALAPTSPAAVMLGLGVLGSAGSGAMLALGLVVVARESGWLKGTMLGLALGAGLMGAELIWGSASLLSLTRGAGYVLGWVVLIAPVSGAAGAGLLALAVRLARGAPPRSVAALPLLGPRDVGPGRSAAESATFLMLLALAILTSFCGLLAMRAGAALSLIGVPEGSFVSGVLVGRTFALCRGGGVVLGGLIHDVLGPRAASVASGLALGGALVVLSRFTGYDNPWDPLIGAVGVASGVGLIAVLASCAHLLGRSFLGHHLGFLNLGSALGIVLVLPLVGVVSAHPQGVLIGAAGACFATALACLWSKPVDVVDQASS